MSINFLFYSLSLIKQAHKINNWITEKNTQIFGIYELIKTSIFIFFIY